MVLCEWCGDENVTPKDVYFAEMKNGKPLVYRFYLCNICNLEFKELLDEDDPDYKGRLDNKGRRD